MATAAQIAANQANSLKSTGPRTPEGRAKSSMNALKHGQRSSRLARLREESFAFEERLRKWKTTGAARNDVEEYLVYRNVCLSFELDRVDRARLERCSTLIENSESAELDEVHELGKRLFYDAAGPTPLYGSHDRFLTRKLTSWTRAACDPNDPSVLVRRIERTETGCVWLKEQLRTLREQLETVGFWQSPDRLKMIRMLGLQPLQANEDVRVATVFAASYQLKPGAGTEFDDLLSDMGDMQLKRYVYAVRERWPDLYRDREQEEWKQMLIDLIDQNVDRLDAKLEEHEQNAEIDAERTFARLSFDPTPEGDTLRNYQLKCADRLMRGVEAYRKYRAKAGRRSRENDGEGPDEPGPDGSDDRDRDFATLGGALADPPVSRGVTDLDDACASASANHADSQSFFEPPAPGCDATEAGENARCVSDPERAEGHVDASGGLTVISEDVTIEADLDQTMSIIEPQDAVRVRANADSISGLDKEADQPQSGDPGDDEHGEIGGFPIADRISDLERDASRGQKGGGTAPLVPSKRAKRGLPGEFERKSLRNMIWELEQASSSVRTLLKHYAKAPS
jgi:hypothetical protein